MNDKPDTNEMHLQRNKPFLVDVFGARHMVTIAAPTLYAATWTAQQEFGDENVLAVMRWVEPDDSEKEEEQK